MLLDVWVTFVHTCTVGVQTRPVLCTHPTSPFSNISRQLTPNYVSDTSPSMTHRMLPKMRWWRDVMMRRVISVTKAICVSVYYANHVAYCVKSEWKNLVNCRCEVTQAGAPYFFFFVVTGHN